MHPFFRDLRTHTLSPRDHVPSYSLRSRLYSCTYVPGGLATDLVHHDTPVGAEGEFRPIYVINTRNTRLYCLFLVTFYTYGVRYDSSPHWPLHDYRRVDESQGSMNEKHDTDHLLRTEDA